MIRSYSPDKLLNEKVGIVNFNQVGSSVSQDSGRDAAYLADTFGLNVISADRPGSGMLLPRPGIQKRLGADYASEIARVGKLIAKEAESMGLERIVAYGRSAGALGVLALASTDTLPIEGIYAPEPVGLFLTDPKLGRKHFNDYNKKQAQIVANQTDFPDLIRPNPTDTTGLDKALRAATIVPFFLNDSHNNAIAWSQPIGAGYAEEIAAKRPDIFTVIDFAEHSLVANNYIKAEMIALRGLRDALGINQPFQVNVVPNTVHSSFDNRSFSANRMSPVVKNVLDRNP